MKSKQFEYINEFISYMPESTLLNIQQLNKLGEDGWELVSANYEVLSEGAVCVFKREKNQDVYQELEHLEELLPTHI